MNLLHIESRPSKQSAGEYEFLVECDATKGSLAPAFEELRKKSSDMQVLSRNVKDNAQGVSGKSYNIQDSDLPF